MSNQEVEAEKSSVTKATVVPGLGYPAGRLERSAENTGWQGVDTPGDFRKVEIMEKVSRETF